MNNQELSYKLKYILHELGMNKTEFLNACRQFNPSISKPTILNAINGKNTIAPTIETLSTIIKVCQTSGIENLKTISYDFLLNDNIKKINAEYAVVYQEIGLRDDVIERLKQFNHPLYFDYGSIINYFLIHTPAKYWKTLEMLKRTCDIQKEIQKTNIQDSSKMKTMLKLWDEEDYSLYIKENFKNIWEEYSSLKNNMQQKKEKEIIKKIENLKQLLPILEIHFAHLLFLQNQKLIETIKG